MKTLSLIYWGLLMLALAGCANDPVNSSIATLKSPNSTPEQKAAARRFLEWKLAQNQRAEAYGRVAATPVAAHYDDQQAQLDRIEQQNRDIQQDVDNIQAQQINGGHW